MRVLVACEFSGVVREAFRKKRHDAWSCDILPSEDNSPYHIQDDVLNHLDENWDMMIAHPPCTYLCNSGVSWLHKDDSRWEKLNKASEFFKILLTQNIPKICVENPIPHKYGNLPKYTQIIQPFQFGDPHRKSTCLWLKNLPKLKPTNIVEPQMVKLKNGETMSKFHRDTFYLPKEQRGHVRSKTFKGIAKAMAEQWT